MEGLKNKQIALKGMVTLKKKLGSIKEMNERYESK
jgi:hypothetical protein